MTVTTPALLRCSAVLMISAWLLAATPLTFASDQVWVRIHHAATDQAVAAMDRGSSSLEDYGTFLWGEVSAAEAAGMKNQGVRISVSENPFLLTLGGETFDPKDLVEPLHSPRTAGDAGWHLVQFDGPARPGWVRALRATGLEIVQPVHPFSYYVWGTGPQVNAARGLTRVRWAGALQPGWKVQPHLRGFDAQPRATMALASAHVDQRELASEISRFAQVHSITPLNRHFNIVHMDAPGHNYSALAEVAGIYTVQYIRPETGPRGEMSNQSVVGNYDGSGVVFPGYVDWLNDTGYDGAGVTVGVVDGGVRTSHIDLASRIVPCVPSGDSPTSCTSANDDHGTHVAGAVAGTGATGITNAAGFLRGQGMAPGASVIQQRYPAFLGAGPGSMIPDGMLKIYRESALSGALLTNNSWGPTGSPQGYDIPTKQIDFISRDADPATPGHQPVLAVWSIMNGNGDSNGQCAPSSLGSPDEAKNLFAVGSTSLQNTNGTQMANIFRVSSNSGHGPACDGRRVPHIVAPGCFTDSTASGSDTEHTLTNMCGTSMASPVVSGAIAVWAEKYIAEVGQNPSPALTKAVFSAAARDLVGNQNADGGIMGHRPDRFQGYGRLDLDLVMNHGLEVFMVDQETVFTAAGQDWTIGLNAVDPTQPIRIMLAWTDAPGHGMGGTTPAWVNDLDLVVEADGLTYFGNVIGADGWSATGGSPDDRNNLEGVFLSPAQHGGAINLTVVAADLSGDALNPYDPEDPSQDFALACYNCVFGDPTFSISLEPNSLDACLPDSGSTDYELDINIGTIGFYNGTLQLAVLNAPTGSINVLDAAKVAAPGASGWTMTVDASVTSGSYLVTVSGDDGEAVKTADLNLVLDMPLKEGPTLIAPESGAIDTSPSPEFEWAAMTDVSRYRLQIATAADFTDIVLDEWITGTEVTPPGSLADATVYYWRVLGSNLCGGSEWSDTFSFTTPTKPQAAFSATKFNFAVSAGGRDSAMLTISNIGTGSLSFDISLADIMSPGQFTGFAFEDWHLVNSPDSINGSVSLEPGSPAGVLVTGGDNAIAGTTDFEILSPLSGLITFDWGYQSSDTACWDSGGYAVNGTYTKLACNDAAVPFFDASASIEIGAGETFALRVHTEDGLLGSGTLGITDFEFTPHACLEPVTPSWLTVVPTAGSIAQGESAPVDLMAELTGLSDGNYLAYLCISTNDTSAGLIAIPVALTVDGGSLFFDRFEEMPVK
ncbi:MAG: S8 family serine peptidase [Wenzhouxiangella sp.]